MACHFGCHWENLQLALQEADQLLCRRVIAQPYLYDMLVDLAIWQHIVWVAITAVNLIVQFAANGVMARKLYACGGKLETNHQCR